MSAIAIKNIIHRNISKQCNFLVYTLNNKCNLSLYYFNNLATNISLFSDRIKDNRLINFCQLFYLFSYNGIITDHIDKNMIDFATINSMPIYCFCQYPITHEHISILEQYDNLFLITYRYFYTGDKHPQIFIVPWYDDSFESENNKEVSSNKVFILGYNLSYEILQQISSALTKYNIVYDIQKEIPLSSSFLYKKIQMYKYCIDFSNLSLMEYIISNAAGTVYIHNNRYIDNTGGVFIDTSNTTYIDKLINALQTENFSNNAEIIYNKSYCI